MHISFRGKYKSITDFDWSNIPHLAVITGPNGTGKSQLLELIFSSINDDPRMRNYGLTIDYENDPIKKSEVTYIKGEWQLADPGRVHIASIQKQLEELYLKVRQPQFHHRVGIGSNPNDNRINSAIEELLKKTGKTNVIQVTPDEFNKNFEVELTKNHDELSHILASIFFNYRLSEIELQAKQLSQEQIVDQLGEKPWKVFREIIKESKLAFEINDPSELGFRDTFQLKLTHSITNEVVAFADLSSGEKVLLSLVFYLYNSKENKRFPKLLLLDEPDAHLHPTMSQQFLNVIKNILVDKYNVRVIITTHSPSTVILAPAESIYEMSIVSPRIQKAASKNHAISLLTSGLIYVGEGTKYLLVEDNDDVEFYSYIYNQLVTDKHINGDIPLVFISASTKDKSGGKDVVQNWVTKLQDSGLENIIQGLIDSDSGNAASKGVFQIDRYSIENYLIDPIITYAALMDKEKHFNVQEVALKLGDEYKLKLLSSHQLQKITNDFLTKVEPHLSSVFHDYNPEFESIRFEVCFNNGICLLYPKWLLKRRGKTILQELYNRAFSSPVINYSTLFKAFRRLNLFPNDIIEKFIQIRGASQES